MGKADDWRVTDDGRIYRSGRKAYPNGDLYSVRMRLMTAVICP